MTNFHYKINFIKNKKLKKLLLVNYKPQRKNSCRRENNKPQRRKEKLEATGRKGRKKIRDIT